MDGQQRLTSLYSVIKNRPVIDDEYQRSHLAIAFRRKDQRFAVPDAANDRDPEFISDVSQLWTGQKPRHRFQMEFIERLRDSRGHSVGDQLRADPGRVSGLAATFGDLAGGAGDAVRRGQ